MITQDAILIKNLGKTRMDFKTISIRATTMVTNMVTTMATKAMETTMATKAMGTTMVTTMATSSFQDQKNHLFKI